MAIDLDYVSASDGTGEAVQGVVTNTRSISATTLLVDSTANFPPKFIATTGVLNENDEITPGTATVFRGHLDSGNVVIEEFAPGYSDAGNAVGDVVLLKPTTEWADLLHDFLAVSHDADGTISGDGIDQIAEDLANHEVRLKPRISVAASSATLTPDIDDYNVYELNAQAANLTLANPTGTPNDGDVLILRLKDNGTTRTISYGTDYVNISGLDSITTTTVSKWHVFGIMYNAGAAKWQIVSITTEA